MPMYAGLRDRNRLLLHGLVDGLAVVLAHCAEPCIQRLVLIPDGEGSAAFSKQKAVLR